MGESIVHVLSIHAIHLNRQIYVFSTRLVDL